MTESRKLRRVVDGFGKEYRKYLEEITPLWKKQNELKKELEKVEQELEKLKEPCWIERMVVPIADEMVKRMPGMEYDYWESDGIESILTVYFFPKGTKSCEEIFTGDKSKAISFIIGEFAKAQLEVKDYTRELGVFKKGSLFDLSGMNYPVVPVKLDVEWLLEWLEKQNRRSTTKTSSCIDKEIREKEVS